MKNNTEKNITMLKQNGQTNYQKQGKAKQNTFIPELFDTIGMCEFISKCDKLQLKARSRSRGCFLLFSQAASRSKMFLEKQSNIFLRAWNKEKIFCVFMRNRTSDLRNSFESQSHRDHTVSEVYYQAMTFVVFFFF